MKLRKTQRIPCTLKELNSFYTDLINRIDKPDPNLSFEFGPNERFANEKFEIKKDEPTRLYILSKKDENGQWIPVFYDSSEKAAVNFIHKKIIGYIKHREKTENIRILPENKYYDRQTTNMYRISSGNRVYLIVLILILLSPLLVFPYYLIFDNDKQTYSSTSTSINRKLIEGYYVYPEFHNYYYYNNNALYKYYQNEGWLQAEEVTQELKDELLDYNYYSVNDVDSIIKLEIEPYIY